MIQIFYMGGFYLLQGDYIFTYSATCASVTLQDMLDGNSQCPRGDWSTNTRKIPSDMMSHACWILSLCTTAVTENNCWNHDYCNYQPRLFLQGLIMTHHYWQRCLYIQCIYRCTNMDICTNMISCFNAMTMDLIVNSSRMNTILIPMMASLILLWMPENSYIYIYI